MNHETAGCLGDNRIVRLSDNFALHLREPSPALQAPPLKAHRLANGKFRPVADIGLRGETLDALQPQPIRHHVVKQAEDDAAVGNVAIAGVPGIRRELGPANILVDPEPNMQPDRVAGPAYKASVGFFVSWHLDSLLAESASENYAELAHLDAYHLQHYDAQMRTTLTIDDDLAAALKEIARESGKPFKFVVNTMLRNGLTTGAKPTEPRPRYRVASAPRGFMPGLDALKLNQLVDELETEAFLLCRHHAAK